MSKFVRATDPADPNRCQSVGAHGQCPFLAIPGYKNCARHAGNSVGKAEAKASTRLYHLAQWQVQFEEQVGHPGIKSLRDEIAIMRVMLQERLNLAKSSHDLVMMSSSLGQMIRQISELVNGCQKIEKELGQMLDKTQATQFAQQIVATVSQYIDDADILAALSEDLANAITQLIPDPT